jgi:hypothetical protein
MSQPTPGAPIDCDAIAQVERCRLAARDAYEQGKEPPKGRWEKRFDIWSKPFPLAFCTSCLFTLAAFVAGSGAKLVQSWLETGDRVSKIYTEAVARVDDAETTFNTWRRPSDGEERSVVGGNKKTILDFMHWSAATSDAKPIFEEFKGRSLRSLVYEARFIGGSKDKEMVEDFEAALVGFVAFAQTHPKVDELLLKCQDLRNILKGNKAKTAAAEPVTKNPNAKG